MCWLVWTFCSPPPHTHKMQCLRLLRSFKSHSYTQVKGLLYYYRQAYTVVTAFKQNPKAEVNRAQKAVNSFTRFAFSTTILWGGYHSHLTELSFSSEN